MQGAGAVGRLDGAAKGRRPESSGRKPADSGGQYGGESAAAAAKPAAHPPEKSGGFYKFLLIAGILATLLGVWYAKESGSEQSRYERAVTLMNSGEYVEAIDIFEKLADYEDSEDYLLLAKAGYVDGHLDHEDSRTYWYLEELKDLSEGYREVYETLYQWKVEFLAVNTGGGLTLPRIFHRPAQRTRYTGILRLPAALPGLRRSCTIRYL